MPSSWITSVPNGNPNASTMEVVVSINPYPEIDKITGIEIGGISKNSRNDYSLMDHMLN